MTTISIELTKAAATLANALIASNTKQGYSDYIATRNALLAITTSEDFHRIEDASKGIIDCKQGTYDNSFATIAMTMGVPMMPDGSIRIRLLKTTL